MRWCESMPLSDYTTSEMCELCTFLTDVAPGEAVVHSVEHRNWRSQVIPPDNIVVASCLKQCCIINGGGVSCPVKPPGNRFNKCLVV